MRYVVSDVLRSALDLALECLDESMDKSHGSAQRASASQDLSFIPVPNSSA